MAQEPHRSQPDSSRIASIADAFENALEAILTTKPVISARLELFNLLRESNAEPHGALRFVYDKLMSIQMDLRVLSTAPYGTLSTVEVQKMEGLKAQRHYYETMRHVLETIFEIVDLIICRIFYGEVPTWEELYEALADVAALTGWSKETPLPKGVLENFEEQLAHAIPRRPQQG